MCELFSWKEYVQMMTVTIVVHQPRKDWNNKNVKKFVFLQDFSYFNSDPAGVIIDNELLCNNSVGRYEHRIPKTEISSVIINY